MSVFAPTTSVRLRPPAKLEYCLAKMSISPKLREAVARIKEAYEQDVSPWIIGYSGIWALGSGFSEGIFRGEAK